MMLQVGRIDRYRKRTNSPQPTPDLWRKPSGRDLQPFLQPNLRWPIKPRCRRRNVAHMRFSQRQARAEKSTRARLRYPNHAAFVTENTRSTSRSSLVSYAAGLLRTPIICILRKAEHSGVRSAMNSLSPYAGGIIEKCINVVTKSGGGKTLA